MCFDTGPSPGRPFREALADYYHDRIRSVAAEDRLRAAMPLAPAGTQLSVAGRTWSDTECRYVPCRFSASKLDDDRWEIKDHWFFAPGQAVPDGQIARSLIVALGMPGAVLSCRVAADGGPA